MDKTAQEPYGWYDNHDIHNEKQSDESIALYTHPHQWQGLTEEEFIYFTSWVDAETLSQIEKTLKEKNGYEGS